MAFLPAMLPWLAAGGAAVQGVQAKNAENYNAKVMGQQHDLSINQANAQEGILRRGNREVFGRQMAAFAGAGVGYGGSSEGALDQSAVNQEYDALNTRYKGSITAHGYGVQAGLNRQQGNIDMTQASLLAGGALLKGRSSDYSMAGVPADPG
jgi:hypothetical protein